MSEWIDVGPADALADETPFNAEAGDWAIVVVRCGEDVYAVEDRCTHDGEPLAEAPVESCQIICPRHGARFCLRSGAALTPPAYEPLRTFAVEIRAGRLHVEVPE
jgi:3-phenylpropionate/trans-cinnamate dioxygenase ferredoxin component